VVGQFAFEYLNNRSLHVGYITYFQHKTTVANKLNHTETRTSVSVAYDGRFDRVFTRLATSPKLWRFSSRGGWRLYHKPFEHLNRLAVDYNHQTMRST